MQLLCQHSEEGDVETLGIFPLKVKRFASDLGLKVPHMGWNNLVVKDNPLLKNISTKDYVYYVHSYYVEVGEDTIATCDYGLAFSAALQKDNFYATQFHPEKSGDIGEQILTNFIEL